jgi:hypothetical protein
LRSGGATRWVAPFVLAMICLRALIPVGFMLAPVQGRLDVVICDSAAPVAVHHHSGHDPAGHVHTSGDSTCPFAQSGAPAPLPSLPKLAVLPIAGPVLLVTQLAQTYSQFGPSRNQSPRGPPQLT